MSYLSGNIKFLRGRKKITQVELASELKIKRASIGSYEENRSEPKLDTLNNMCNYFQVSLDELINTDLSKENKKKKEFDNDVRILTVAVDENNEELITLVPFKAAAGYLDGYGDIDFIENLPKFNLPFSKISSNKTYRAFEINGDSMFPITSGSYIICEFVLDIKELKNGDCYVLVSYDDGIVYKRILNQYKETGEFVLKSDNTEYKPYKVSCDTIREAWKAVGYVSFNLPEENDYSINELSNIVKNLQSQLKSINNK